MKLSQIGIFGQKLKICVAKVEDFKPKLKVRCIFWNFVYRIIRSRRIHICNLFFTKKFFDLIRPGFLLFDATYRLNDLKFDTKLCDADI